MPVLCKSTMCSYTYVESDALIQAFSAVGTTVTIDGINLPTALTSVRISNQDCEVSANSATQITCQTANPFVAGSWMPEVRTADGLVALDVALLPMEEPVTVNAAIPDTFYEEGGDTVVISGTGFPEGLETGDNVSVTFTDGTVCHIVMSTPTEVQCKVEEFVTEVLRRELQTFNMIIDVNGQQVEVAVVLQAARLRLTSVTPESVSPIIPQLLTLQLNDAYDSTNMELDTFTVGLAATDTDNARPNGDLVRWLNVVDFDKTAKTITVKYGGAYTGKYKILLESQLQGAFRTGGRYEVKFEFTDFNPKAGSKYGGQLITIDGSHFSNDPLKNPIKIGYEYISGVVHYCDVLESADTQIKCRMRLDYEREAGDQELIVFASTFEEADC